MKILRTHHVLKQLSVKRMSAAAFFSLRPMNAGGMIQKALSDKSVSLNQIAELLTHKKSNPHFIAEIFRNYGDVDGRRQIFWTIASTDKNMAVSVVDEACKMGSLVDRGVLALQLLPLGLSKIDRDLLLFIMQEISKDTMEGLVVSANERLTYEGHDELCSFIIAQGKAEGIE